MPFQVPRSGPRRRRSMARAIVRARAILRARGVVRAQMGDATVCGVPLQCGNMRGVIPRALPWAVIFCPVGAGIREGPRHAAITFQQPPRLSSHGRRGCSAPLGQETLNGITTQPQAGLPQSSCFDAHPAVAGALSSRRGLFGAGCWSAGSPPAACACGVARWRIALNAPSSSTRVSPLRVKVLRRAL